MKNKGFTLIELLVVVFLIGFLSSIVLVYFKGTGGKARISKSLEFSHNIQNAIDAEAVGIWNFDEGAGNVAVDGSGFGNTAVIYGASFTDETPHKAVGSGGGRYSLNFDGSSYVDAGNGAILNIKPAITIEAWVKNEAGETKGDLVTKIEGGGYFLTYLGTNGAEFGIYGTTNASRIAHFNIQDQNWHQIVGTYKGTEAELRIFIDAKEYIGTLTGTIPAAIGTNSQSLWIGRDDTGNGYFNGLIDDVRIYDKTMSAGEIQKHYTEGLKKYELAKINVQF